MKSNPPTAAPQAALCTRLRVPAASEKRVLHKLCSEGVLSGAAGAQARTSSFECTNVLNVDSQEKLQRCKDLRGVEVADV